MNDKLPSNAPELPLLPIVATTTSLQTPNNQGNKKEGIPKLPNMNEFSPSVVELGPLLKVIKQNEGDKERLQTAVYQSSHIQKAKNDQHLNRANNVLIGMSQCGLFDLKTNTLTALGEELRLMKDEKSQNRRFAEQLLRNCHGEELLEVCRSLRKRNEELTGDNIRAELKVRGFKVTTNEGNPSKMRLWLEKSGVINNTWEIDEAVYETLVGISSSVKHEWLKLSRSQRLFLETLRRLSVGKVATWHDGSHVKKLCCAEWGPNALPEGSLRAKVLDPLEAEGWIKTTGKGDGRGGKIGQVQAAEKLLDIKALPEGTVSRRGIPKDLLDKMDTPMVAIYSDLGSTNIYKKGIALELLCLRLCLGLGLRPVEMRKRGIRTQGAEVDVIANGIHLHYSRWMFQCKNTPGTAIDLEDLAKEVGLAVLLKAHVIVMVTTGKFTKTVIRYANGVASETVLQVILIDGKCLEKIKLAGEGALVDLLQKQARDTLRIKEGQVREDLMGADSIDQSA